MDVEAVDVEAVDVEAMAGTAAGAAAGTATGAATGTAAGTAASAAATAGTATTADDSPSRSETVEFLLPIVKGTGKQTNQKNKSNMYTRSDEKKINVRNILLNFFFFLKSTRTPGYTETCDFWRGVQDETADGEEFKRDDCGRLDPSADGSRYL